MSALKLTLVQKLFYDSVNLQITDPEVIRYSIADFLYEEIICKDKIEKTGNRVHFTVANRVVGAIDKDKLKEAHNKLREAQTDAQRDAASNLEIELIVEARNKVVNDIKKEFETWMTMLDSLIEFTN